MQLKVENFIGSSLFSLIRGDRIYAAAVVSVNEIEEMSKAVKNNTTWLKNDEIALIPIRLTSFNTYAATYSILIGAEQAFVNRIALETAISNAVNRTEEATIVGGTDG